jgi:hypothetical protein
MLIRIAAGCTGMMKVGKAALALRCDVQFTHVARSGVQMTTCVHQFSKEFSMRTITPPEHQEGIVARTIEQQTAKIPSDFFLWAAGLSIIGSLLLKARGRHQDALFVGQWPAPFLLLGVYNKLVKLLGSD